MARQGFAGFSARAVAKAIGYSVGTIYNVFGGVDQFVVDINTETFSLWADALERALATGKSKDRIALLVRAYFGFAAANRNLWMAIYDHHGVGALDDEARAKRARLTDLVDAEVARFLKRETDKELQRLTRSLIATVHGHCILALGGSYAVMGEPDPMGQAIRRVHEILDQHRSNRARAAVRTRRLGADIR